MLNLTVSLFCIRTAAVYKIMCSCFFRTTHFVDVVSSQSLKHLLLSILDSIDLSSFDSVDFELSNH